MRNRFLWAWLLAAVLAASPVAAQQTSTIGVIDANGEYVAMNVSAGAGIPSLGIAITGTFTGTLTFGEAADGTCASITAVPAFSTARELQTTASAAGLFVLANPGYRWVCVKATSWTSGSATVVLTRGFNTPETPASLSLESAELEVGAQGADDPHHVRGSDGADPYDLASESTLADVKTAAESIDTKLPALSSGRVPVTTTGTVTAELSATDNAVLDSIDTSTAATKTAVESIDAKLPELTDGKIPVAVEGLELGEVEVGAQPADDPHYVRCSDGSEAAPCEVTGTVTIEDGGGSITVDGTVGISGTVTVTATDLDVQSGGADLATATQAAAIQAAVEALDNAVVTATLGDNHTNTQDVLATMGLNYVFDGSTWDRWTGAVTQSGTWTVTANAGTNLNTSALLTTSAFNTVFGSSSLILGTQADNLANTSDGLQTTSFLYGFDGSTWDRLKATNGALDVNIASGSTAGPTDTDDGDIDGAQDVGLSASLLYSWDGDSWVRAQVAQDWTASSTIGSTAPGVMLEAKDFDGSALPQTAGIAEGEAVPAAGSLYGVQYTMLVSEDGSQQYGTSTTPLYVRTADPCSGAKSFVAVSQTSSTQIISGVASNRIYICSILLTQPGDSTQTFSLVNGTGTTCGTGTAAVIGSTTAANGVQLPFSLGSGNGAVAKSTADGANVCLLQSGSDRIAGVIGYVVAPN